MEMNYIKYLLVALACALTPLKGLSLVVVDSTDNTPIVRTPVFNTIGVVLGLTDVNGFIEVDPLQYPVTVKGLGYEEYICRDAADSIWMTPAVYELDAVNVIPVERPVMRAVCYMREYISASTDNDTVMRFSEYSADVFIPVHKVKKFKAQRRPRILNHRTVIRITDKTGLDSIFTPAYREDNISWETLLEFPDKPLTLTPLHPSVNSRTDTIQGKYAIAELIRINPERIIAQTDYLADFKNHSFSPLIFKLLGLTMDIVEMQGNWIYKTNDNGVYSVADIISGTFSFNITGKGKWLKKALKTKEEVSTYGYFEIYPLRIEFLTVDEAKAMIKDDFITEKIEVSPLAPPLSPSVTSMLERVRKK